MKFTTLQNKLTTMFSTKEEAPSYLKGSTKPKTYEWKFGNRSEVKLVDVDADLVAVARLALTYSPVDFGITCGLRTQHEQNQLLATGKTQTRHSRHQDGMAIDVIAYVDGKVSWEIKHYIVVAQAFAEAARELDVPIRWGAAWTHLLNDMDAKEANHDYVATRRKQGRNPFIDGPHFEIPKK
jgi:peptidoglycan L-alanyl-D-glutamate endopeptidase CwlK